MLFNQFAFSQTNQQMIDDHQAAVQQFRDNRNTFMLNPATSPLSQAQIQKFAGLPYFTIDYKYLTVATFVKESPEKDINLSTTSGGTKTLTRVGKINFVLNGYAYSLSVFRNKYLTELGNDNQQLFVPFTDLTNGSGTNSSGRYLKIDPPSASNTVIVDFNLAINPFSAYSNSYTGIIAPPENSMQMMVSSGERKYEDR